MADRGAAPQRLLWASTGTKDPSYPDTKYVDELIGFATVNTVPPATLDAFFDHGSVSADLQYGLDEAEAVLAKLKKAGIDLQAITDTLEKNGVNAFGKAFESLLGAVEGKRARLAALE